MTQEKYNQMRGDGGWRVSTAPNISDHKALTNPHSIKVHENFTLYTTFCQTVVLDGRDGSIMWSLNTSLPEYSTDVATRTAERNRDAFIFRVKGRNEAPNRNVLAHGVFHQAGELVHLIVQIKLIQSIINNN